MKNKILISAISMMAVMPAFADIALNDNTPTCDSSTIGAISGSTALDAVWNIVNQTCSAGQYFDMTTATCVTCTANSYCPGGTYNVESQTNGSNSCPSGFGLSATGSSAQTDCYRTCTTSDVAHSTEVSGGYYYGDNNQCEPTSCDTGYTAKAGVNLSVYASQTPTANAYGYINTNGEYTSGENTHDSTYYGISGTNTWGADFGYAIIHGRAICSTHPGHRNTTNNNDASWDNPTKVGNLTDETGSTGAKYCYCNITGFKSIESNDWTNLTSDWVFYYVDQWPSACQDRCALNCANYVRTSTGYRSALFSAVQPISAHCEANTINITWYNEGSVHDENTCTYAESVTLPETNPERTGYNFTGWTVRPAATPAQVE